MKQKFTITIADIEMNVVCDESPEAVEAIVGIIDRKMREINLHSKRCSKNEAALLCALDYCAENIKLMHEVSVLKKQNEALTKKCEGLEDKLATPIQLRMDLPEAEEEEKEEAPAKEAEEMPEVSTPADEKAESAPVQNAPADEKAEPTSPKVPTAHKAERREQSPNRAQKRVRSMFDLISFDNE